MPNFEYKTLNYESGDILIRKFLGQVKLENIIESWKYLIDNKLLTESHLGVINDLGDAQLELNQPSFEKLIEYLRANKIFYNLKLAVICDSPQKIIFPMMGEFNVTDLHIKPFTTVEAAINWILNQ